MMKMVRANGTELRCDIQGEGPWLTLCHGLACDLTMWDEQVAAFARHFTVLRYDLRGHGDSSQSDCPYSFELMVNDLLGLLDALHIQSTHLAGLSMGGMIAQHFAMMTPERLNRLVLCSTSSFYGANAGPIWDQRIATAREHGMGPLVAPSLQRWFTEPFLLENPELMKRIGDTVSNTSVDTYIGCGRMVAGVDTTAKLQRITAPTLVLVGDQDPGTPPAMAEDIAAAIPGARLEVLPQASHLLNVEQPQLFNVLLREFLG